MATSRCGSIPSRGSRRPISDRRTIMARSDFRFHVTKRVRYAEIDAQRVVFNSRYPEYFDIGITEYCPAVGVYDRWPDHSSPEFPVARAEVDYKVPILLDAQMHISVHASRVGPTSIP